MFNIKNKGFTLIELLVVVLIIGILAAIAVSQYQAVIMRSRIAQSLTMVKSIAESERRYYELNGVYAPYFNMLDISVDPSCTGTQFCYVKPFLYSIDDIQRNAYPLISAYYSKTKINIYGDYFTCSYALADVPVMGIKAGQISCHTRDEAVYIKAVKSMGGVWNGVNDGRGTYIIPF